MIALSVGRVHRGRSVAFVRYRTFARVTGGMCAALLRRVLDFRARQQGSTFMTTFYVDIEPTNRCNAKCHFCPRDMTPHQGLMTPEVFGQALGRTVEFRDVVRDRFNEAPSFTQTGKLGGAIRERFEQYNVVVNLCGLGEPLLNRHTPEYVRGITDEGFSCGLSTNASVLDEKRGRALLDAGLTNAYINVGDRDEAYEEVYKLPFERTRDNVVRFAEMARDRCEVFLVLVDFRRDPEHLREMRDYWRGLGIQAFMEFEIMNRGGTLFVDHMQFESYPELADARALLVARKAEPACIVPFIYLFVGYDGQYYLCCSDWEKQVPLGSVFDTSFAEVTQQKLEHVTSREPICKSCNHDPLNRLAAEMRAMAADEADEADRDELVEELLANTVTMRGILDKLDSLAAGSAPVGSHSGAGKRRIPIVVE
jgi:MoaA/NifB/PqqE/SkfB family radical SAM enzyme